MRAGFILPRSDIKLPFKNGDKKNVSQHKVLISASKRYGTPIPCVYPYDRVERVPSLLHGTRPQKHASIYRWYRALLLLV